MAVGVAAAMALLGGCDNAKKKEALLMDENAGLRDQIQDLRTALDNAENQRRQLEEQSRRAESERPAVSSSFGSGLAGVVVESRVGELVAIIEGDVLFASGSTALRPEARRTLDTLASQIRKDFPSQPLRLVGFTDTDPIRKSNFPSNFHLGFQRAYEVGQFLQSKGLTAKNMSYTSFGPEMPRETKAKSRRVEVAIVTE